MWSPCFTAKDCNQTPLWQYVKSMFYCKRLYPNPIVTVCEVHVLLQKIVSKPHCDCMWSPCFTAKDCNQIPLWLYGKSMFYCKRLYPNPILTVCEVHVLLKKIASKPHCDSMWSPCFTAKDCNQTPLWLYVKSMFYCKRLYPNPVVTVCEVHVLLQKIASKARCDCMWNPCFTAKDCIQSPSWLYVKSMFYCKRLYPNPIVTVCEVHVLLQKTVSKEHCDCMWSPRFTAKDCIQTPLWLYVKSMFYCKRLYPNPIVTVCEVHVLLQKIVSKHHCDHMSSTDCIQTTFWQYVRFIFYLNRLYQTPFWQYVKFMFYFNRLYPNPFWQCVKFMLYFNRLYPNPFLIVCEVHVLLQQIVSKPRSDCLWSSCCTSTDCIQTPFWQYVKFMLYCNILYPNPILTVCEVHVLMQQIVSKPHSDCMWSLCFTSTDCIQTPFWLYVKFMFDFNRLYPNPILTDCEVPVVLQQIVSKPILTVCKVHVLLQHFVSKPHSDSIWSSCFASTYCIQTHFWQHYVRFMFYFNKLYPNPILTVCEVHVLLQHIVSKPHSDNSMWSSCFTATYCIQIPLLTVRKVHVLLQQIVSKPHSDSIWSSCFTSAGCVQTPFWQYVKFMFYFSRLYPNLILTVCEVHVLLQQIVSKSHSDSMWSSCFTSTDCIQTPFWQYVKFMFYNRLYPNLILTVCEVHVLLQQIVSKPHSDSMWSSCFTSTDCIQTPFWQYVKFMF